MEQQPFRSSAFLVPSHIPHHSHRTGKAACRRAINNPRPAAQETSNRNPPSVSANISVNEIVEGVITRLTNFGAFVDIGNGQTGLVHISEVADAFVQDISQYVSVGERHRVRVLSVDPEKNRIGLSIRQAVPMTSGYERVIELGGDWGHPWGDHGQTKFMDLGPRPDPRPHHWQPDPSLFRKWDTVQEEK